MARYPNYPKAPFSASQNFLARDPAGSGQVIRVQGQSILDAAVQEILDRGDIVQAVGTLTEAKANDYESGIYVLTGGNTVTLDGGQAIYRVSDPGSGGIVMDNGNELVLLFVANTPANIITPFDSIADLPEVNADYRVSVTGYHPSTTVGGGEFVGNASARHDGVIYFDPDRSGEIGTAAYYVDSGVDVACWERVRHSDVMSAYSAGCKLDWDGASGTDDTEALKALHDGGISYYLEGKTARITESLPFFSGMRVYCNGGGVHKENAGYIFTTNGASVDNCEVISGVFTGNSLASLADCRGAGIGFNNSARNISFIDCNASQIDIAFNWDNARSCHIERGRYACKSSVIYTNKSAECTIDSVVFAKDDAFVIAGTKGIESLAGTDGYPEGLSVDKTLFFRFEYNLDIEDLFIGGFSDCYFDSNGSALVNRIKYNTKTEGLKFNSCWFFNKGIQFGDDLDSSPKLFRSVFTGCHFNFMQPGIDLEIKKFAHDIKFADCIHDSNQTGTHTGYVCQSQNNRITINNPTFLGYDSYVQFKDVGERNNINNIVNSDGLASPIFLEYPVNAYGVEGYGIYAEDSIASGTYNAGDEIASIDNVMLSSGKCNIILELTNFSAPSTGFLKFHVYDAGTAIASVDVDIFTNASLAAYNANDKAIRVTIPFTVKKATEVKVVCENESGSSPTITAGAFADSMTVVQ